MIRLIVVSDIRLYRDGLAEILSRRQGLCVVAVFETPRRAIQGARSHRPDIVLLDMATHPTRQAIQAFVRSVPETKVVALAIGDSDADVIECAEAGVAGFVTRASSLDELVATIESVSRGELVCSPRTTATLLRRIAALAGTRPIDSGRAGRLTAREREIVGLIEEGLSNKEIATRLFIEVATVKNHVHNILGKLEVRRRADAVDELRAAALSPPRGPI